MFKILNQGFNRLKSLVAPKSNASVDQILSAAASKIIQQQEQIDGLLKQQQWRTLSKLTADVLLDQLRQLGPHSAIISYVPSDAEAESFARFLNNIFINAGWVPRPIRPSTLDLTGAPSPVGIQMFCRCISLSGIPVVVGSVIQALKADKIAIWRHVGKDDALPDNQSITILVGHKPQDDSGDDFIH